MNAIDQIKALMKSGDIAEADALCRRELASDPDNAAVQLLFATCRELLGDEETFQTVMEDLVPKMEDAVRKEPESEAAKLWRKAGFTLVELLVFALIVGIISVGVLYSCPIQKPMLVRARYSSEAIPDIGNIRTWIELYGIMENRLPFEDSEAGKVMTWRKTEDGNYEPILFNPKGGGEEGKQGNAAKTVRQAAHKEAVLLAETNNILARLEKPLSELTGKFVSPDQIQFVCLAPGSISKDDATSKGGAYAVGVFGSGERGLQLGTGYAAAEYTIAASGRKIVATYENYKPEFDGQLSFFVEDSTEIDIEDFRKRGLIYLPSWTAMTNDYGKAVQAMESAGWQMN